MNITFHGWEFHAEYRPERGDIEFTPVDPQTPRLVCVLLIKQLEENKRLMLEQLKSSASTWQPPTS